jgi:hypothetical protein
VKVLSRAFNTATGAKILYDADLDIDAMLTGSKAPMNIGRQIMKAFGFDEDEPLRTPLDVILGAAGGIAGFTLLAFSFEKSPSPELHRAAIWQL